jgi:hypothetical protein
VVGVGLIEVQLASRRLTVAQPVRAPRSVQVVRTPHESGPGHKFQLATAGGESLFAGDAYHQAMLIDSGGAGRFTLFEHEAHQQRLGGKTSCVKCHHRNVPLDNATSCALCHRDMYRTTDIFHHERHVTANGGKQSCAVCHPDPGAAKSRVSSKACDSCHQPIVQAATLVASGQAVAHAPGIAPGYKLAMHGLCVACHEAEQAKLDEQSATESEDPYLVRCTTCHRGTFADEVELRRRAGWGVAAVSMQKAVGIQPTTR